MAGLKVTLSAAMRARDVSRPTPEHETVAQAREARAASELAAGKRPTRRGRKRGGGSPAAGG